MLPADFELRSRYGVGGLALGYDSLEDYYCEVEDLMSVSGPSEDSPFPRSRPYPQPPHNLTDPDKILKKGTQLDFLFSLLHVLEFLPRRGPCCATSLAASCP